MCCKVGNAAVVMAKRWRCPDGILHWLKPSLTSPNLPLPPRTHHPKSPQTTSKQVQPLKPFESLSLFQIKFTKSHSKLTKADHKLTKKVQVVHHPNIVAISKVISRRQTNYNLVLCAVMVVVEVFMVGRGLFLPFLPITLHTSLMDRLLAAGVEMISLSEKFPASSTSKIVPKFSQTRCQLRHTYALPTLH